MTILDSNIWIATFYPKDSQHQKAQAVIDKIPQPILVPEYVVAEVCTILSRNAGKNVANAFVEQIIDNQETLVSLVDPMMFRELLDFYCSDEHKDLSFVDVALLLSSREHTVITFDKKLARAITKLKKV